LENKTGGKQINWAESCNYLMCTSFGTTTRIIIAGMWLQSDSVCWHSKYQQGNE